MTTVQTGPLSSSERSVLGDIARGLAAPRRQRAYAIIGRRWRTVRTSILAVTGFGFLDVAAFTVSDTAGYAAVGVSLLVIEYLGKERG